MRYRMISGVSMTSRSGSNPVCRMRIPAKKPMITRPMVYGKRSFFRRMDAIMATVRKPMIRIMLKASGSCMESPKSRTRHSQQDAFYVSRNISSSLPH
jgi:hypothetical protein